MNLFSYFGNSATIVVRLVMSNEENTKIITIKKSKMNTQDNTNGILNLFSNRSGIFLKTKPRRIAEMAGSITDERFLQIIKNSTMAKKLRMYNIFSEISL